MYRITGSFINSGATVTEGSTVQFDMTLDNPVITYWVSIYDVNGVPRDVKTESDDSITYTDRWTSLTYAGLSTYRNFTGHIRYHAKRFTVLFVGLRFMVQMAQRVEHFLVIGIKIQWAGQP